MFSISSTPAWRDGDGAGNNHQRLVLIGSPCAGRDLCLTRAYVGHKQVVDGDKSRVAPGSPDLDPKSVRLSLNGTNPGLFRSDVSTFWRSTF